MRINPQIYSATILMGIIAYVVFGCAGIDKVDLYGKETASFNNCLNRGLVFTEDFESERYADNWPVHWGDPVGAGTVANSPKLVHRGLSSAYNEIEKGAHSALGNGEFVPKTPLDSVAFMRIYIMLQEGFSMGQSRSMKLFGLRGGAAIEDAYGGACSKPTGKDKFSVKLMMDNWSELALYFYHPDQIGPCGDVQYSSKLFGGPKLLPGKWYCLELMVKLNTVGRRDGMIVAWVDGQPAIHVDHLRFRDTDAMKIRRFTVETYFGGDLASDTSPQDQRIYIDDFAIGTCPIGCAE